MDLVPLVRRFGREAKKFRPANGPFGLNPQTTQTCAESLHLLQIGGDHARSKITVHMVMPRLYSVHQQKRKRHRQVDPAHQYLRTKVGLASLRQWPFKPIPKFM